MGRDRNIRRSSSASSSCSSGLRRPRWARCRPLPFLLRGATSWAGRRCPSAPNHNPCSSENRRRQQLWRGLSAPARWQLADPVPAEPPRARPFRLQLPPAHTTHPRGYGTNSAGNSSPFLYNHNNVSPGIYLW